MAKGKKTVIKSISLVSDDVVEINSKQYFILDDIKNINILEATSMKITSHGNRIIRFDNSNKIVNIDVKRDIQIYKITFTDAHRASRFKKVKDSSFISNEDKQELIHTALSFVKARQIVEQYTKKDSPLYDKNSSKTTFYVAKEIN